MDTKVQTRYDERIISTSDLEVMAGKYLTKDVKREWKEDFLDQDTGEVVQIKRNELVMQRGVLLTPDRISSLNFYLTSGDIKSVEVSNIQRTGISIEVGKHTIWILTISGGGCKKKRKYILFAQSLEQAITISKDYLEQILEGGFAVEAAKSYSSCIVISDDNLTKMAVDGEGNVVSEDKDKEVSGFYTIQTAVKNQNGTHYYTFLLTATSVDDAKARIHTYIDQTVQQQVDNGVSDGEDWENYELTVLSGSAANVNSVIPKEFSEEYFKQIDLEKEMEPENLLRKVDDLLDKMSSARNKKQKQEEKVNVENNEESTNEEDENETEN